MKKRKVSSHLGYTAEHDIDLYSSGIVIYEDYQFVYSDPEKKNIKGIEVVKTGRNPVEIKNKSKYEVVEEEYCLPKFIINPFECNILQDILNLHNVISFLEKPTPVYDKYLDFCRSYGLMGETSRLVSGFSVENKPSVWSSTYETMQYFQGAIRSIEKCYAMYRYLKGERDLYELDDQDNMSLMLLRNFGNDLSLEEKVKALLLRNINLGTAGIRPQLQLNNQQILVPGYQASSIRAVAYFQLYELISSDQTFKDCFFCGSKFTPTRKNQRFCPPQTYLTIKDARSTCENRYNARLTYGKERIAAGDSIEKWAGELKISAEEMKYKFEEWEETKRRKQLEKG
jgi:hypothetical protein